MMLILTIKALLAFRDFGRKSKSSLAKIAGV
jgi:hypothetical protein